jgi:hypothetical protein
MRYCLLFLRLACILGLTASVCVQSESQVQFEPPGKQEIAKYPLKLERPAGPAQKAIDPVKLRAEANELADLAREVPSEVDQVSRGKLPKDFADKLKRIEKLSKHLRGELTP